MFDNIRNRLAKAIAADTGNSYLDAFFKYLGGQYTQYDVDAPEYLDKGFKQNPDVYTIVSQKATKHSNIPYEVKEVEDKQAKKLFDNFTLSTKMLDSPHQYIRYKNLSSQAFKEDLLPFPMERPNVNQTWADFHALYSTFMDLVGNFYYYMRSPLNGGNAGVPLQVYVLPAHLIKIVLKPNADLMEDENPIRCYMLVEGNIYTEFPAEDVVHVKYANPDYDLRGSHLYGVAPLRAGLRNIQSSNTAIDNNIKTLASGGAFGFIHGKDKVLSDTQAKQIKQRLVEMDSDESRMAKIAGSSAALEFTRISLTTDELKPFDYIQFDQDTLCNVLNWEAQLLNNSKKAASSGSLGGKSEYELSEKRALSKAIIPKNKLLEESFNIDFIPKFKGYENAVFAFNYDDLPEMQPDMVMLSKWISDNIRIGVLNREEGRIALRFPKTGLPEMQVFTVDADVLLLSEAIQTEFNIDEEKNV